MNHFSVCFSVAAVAALAACATPPASQVVAAPAPAVSKAPEPAARCVAEAAKFAVGQSYSAQLDAAARHRTGASSVRVLKPGQMATMEIDAGRLTLDVDARGRVSNARCG